MNSSSLDRRVQRLCAELQRADIQAAAVVPGANFYYLTGVHFHLMERPTMLFVSADGSRHAVIPALEQARWRAAMPDVETLYWQDSDGFDGAFESLVTRFAPGSLAVEGQRIRFFEAECLRRHFVGARLVDAHAIISSMRLCKDQTEIAAMREAIEISERAWLKTIARIQRGMSEAAVKQMLTSAMLAEGADGVAFEPIVLSGAATADPHGGASKERMLRRGDALLFDFGAAWGGYNADITRTIFIETVSEEHRAIYEAVAEANDLGRRIASPQTSLDSVDRQVTDKLKSRGFSELIVHKTGHGLGLDVHEAPQVMIGNNQLLEPGMVITIEPGLYRDGEIGVRIEDDVLIGPDGAVSLTTLDRSLLHVG
jgi:Xaa-Pro aminopeptidase